MNLLIRTSLAVAALATVAACSGAAEPKPDIASLATGSAPATASSAQSVEENRPRYRLDMTPAEREQLMEPWYECAYANGLPKQPPYTAQQKEAAAKACIADDPLPAWELDPKNPELLDFMRKVVDCLHGKGFPDAVLSSDPSPHPVQSDPASVDPNNITESDTQNAVRFLDATGDCELEVFRAK